MNYGGEDLPSEIFVSDKGSDRIRIEVRDYGPAVPTRIWREIKNGVVKQPTEISMRPGSSGMGLYIAAKFANYMNAKFGLIRHRDGTSFYVDLPVSEQLSLV
jgi:signal transduction histidine kinase